MTKKDIILLGVLFALIGFSVTCTVLPAIAGTQTELHRRSE
jgi:hypothetical protein